MSMKEMLGNHMHTISIFLVPNRRIVFIRYKIGKFDTHDIYMFF